MDRVRRQEERLLQQTSLKQIVARRIKTRQADGEAATERSTTHKGVQDARCDALCLSHKMLLLSKPFY